MQGGLAVVRLLVHVGAFGKQQVDEGVGVFDARSHHECGPAGAILGIDVAAFAIQEEFDYGEAIVGGSPVQWHAIVVIAA